jgi:hypothetical protein
MKAVLRKIVSIAMALLLLLSTVSWKVEKHYCMGRLMDTALFVDVDDCGMGMAVYSNGLEKLGKENHCCDDKVILIEGQDDLKISFNDLNLHQQAFWVAFTYSYIDLFSNLAERPVPHELYPPPILVKDIQLLDEVFLI